jgi:hypothetical protein
MSKHPSQVDAASLLAEEKERRLAEERAIAALKLQRKQRLQAMTIKRQRNLDYLKVQCDWYRRSLIRSCFTLTHTFFHYRKYTKAVATGLTRFCSHLRIFTITSAERFQSLESIPSFPWASASPRLSSSIPAYP